MNMRTETIVRHIYAFDELTDEARQNAIERFRSDPYIFAWQDESADTVKEISNTMGWKYEWYSYDGIRYSVRYDMDNDDAADLTGKRAWAYIENNYISRAERPKTYWLGGVIYCDGRKNWKRKSKIWRGIDNFPFTGYCMDCCFSNAWRDWRKNFTLDSTVEDFVELVADYLGEYWTADNEYQISDDGITEMIEANEYEFLVDGTLY